jgi:hypothetical protein
MDRMETVGFIRITGALKAPTNEPFAGVMFDNNGVSKTPVTRWQYERVAAIVGAEILNSSAQVLNTEGVPPEEAISARKEAGKRLSEARKALGVTRSELAGSLTRLIGDAVGNVHHMHVFHWEEGSSEVPPQVWDVLPRMLSAGC